MTSTQIAEAQKLAREWKPTTPRDAIGYVEERRRNGMQ